MGEQYAVTLDQLARLTGRTYRTARALRDRWCNAGWTQSAKLAVSLPPFVWLTSRGSRVADSPFRTWDANPGLAQRSTRTAWNVTVKRPDGLAVARRVRDSSSRTRTTVTRLAGRKSIPSTRSGRMSTRRSLGEPETGLPQATDADARLAASAAITQILRIALRVPRTGFRNSWGRSFLRPQPTVSSLLYGLDFPAPRPVA